MASAAAAGKKKKGAKSNAKKKNQDRQATGTSLRWNALCHSPVCIG
jgi:hypothetical protein